MKRLVVILASLMVFLPTFAQAQGITYNQVITWSGSASTGTAVPSDIIRDVNQTGAWVYGCVDELGGTFPTATFDLEGSYDKLSWFQISQQAVTTSTSSVSHSEQCASVIASGYFPFTRIDVLSINAGGIGTFSANYSASFTPITDQGIQRLGMQPAKVSMAAVADGWSQAVGGTSTAVSTSALSLSSVSVMNPNTSTVYLWVGPATVAPTTSIPQPTLNSNGFIVAVPQAASVTLPFPTPFKLDIGQAATIYTVCSTSPTTVTAPTTPCYVNINATPLNTVDTLVSASGLVVLHAIDFTPW